MPHDRLNLTLDPTTRHLFKDVLARYDEPHRKYHTREHLDMMFEGLEVMRPWLEQENFTQRDIDMIKALIIYHDAYYVVGANDNEKRSAALMIEDMELEGGGRFDS